MTVHDEAPAAMRAYLRTGSLATKNGAPVIGFATRAVFVTRVVVHETELAHQENALSGLRRNCVIVVGNDSEG